MGIKESIQKIIIAYRKARENIKNSGKDSEDISMELNFLENDFSNRIIGLEIDDEYKCMLIEELTDINNIIDIVNSLKDDNNKINFLNNLDKYNINDVESSIISKVVMSFKDDKNKFDFFSKLELDSYKCQILMTMTDINLISELINKPEDKKMLINYFLEYVNLNENNWKFIKMIRLENMVIPHILAKYKYQIPDDIINIIGLDIEKYLGKPLPKDISDMSKYEKIGIDLDAINESVLTSEAQIEFDEQEKAFFNNCKSDSEHKKRIKIKDFIGTISPNLKEGVPVDRIRSWKDLADSLKRMDFNIDGHSESYLFSDNDKEESIKLNGVHGKYYVTGNGNHRLTLLKMRYLTEIKRAKGNPDRIRQIEEEYYIDVTSSCNIPEDKEEILCVNMLSDINRIESSYSDISEYVENGEQVGYKINIGEKEIIVRGKEELKEYLQKRISLIKENSELYQKVFKQFEKYKKDEKYSQLFDKLIEIEEIER